MSIVVGNRLVHALHGIGTVESIEQKEILGMKCRFAVLSFERLQIMVNLDQKNSLVRELMSEAEVHEILDYMGEVNPKLPNYYNKRYNLNLDKMKSGDVKQLAEVVKSLIALSQKKKLGMKDQRMLDKSLAIITAEFSYVLGTELEETQAKIEEVCSVEAAELVAQEV